MDPERYIFSLFFLIVIPLSLFLFISPLLLVWWIIRFKKKWFTKEKTAKYIIIIALTGWLSTLIFAMKKEGFDIFFYPVRIFFIILFVGFLLLYVVRLFRNLWKRFDK